MTTCRTYISTLNCRMILRSSAFSVRIHGNGFRLSGDRGIFRDPHCFWARVLFLKVSAAGIPCSGVQFLRVKRVTDKERRERSPSAQSPELFRSIFKTKTLQRIIKNVPPEENRRDVRLSASFTRRRGLYGKGVGGCLIPLVYILKVLGIRNLHSHASLTGSRRPFSEKREAENP